MWGCEMFECSNLLLYVFLWFSSIPGDFLDPIAGFFFAREQPDKYSNLESKNELSFIEQVHKHVVFYAFELHKRKNRSSIYFSNHNLDNAIFQWPWPSFFFCVESGDDFLNEILLAVHLHPDTQRTHQRLPDFIFNRCTKSRKTGCSIARWNHQSSGRCGGYTLVPTPSRGVQPNNLCFSFVSRGHRVLRRFYWCQAFSLLSGFIFRLVDWSSFISYFPSMFAIISQRVFRVFLFLPQIWIVYFEKRKSRTLR